MRRNGSRLLRRRKSLGTVGRNKNKNSYDRLYNLLASAFKIPFFPSILFYLILFTLSAQLIDWSTEWSNCCWCLQAKFTTVSRACRFSTDCRPMWQPSWLAAHPWLLYACLPADKRLFTVRVIQCVEWGEWPSTSVVGIPSQWPAHIWQVTWVRFAATQTTRGNSTTVIHLAFVICTVAAAFVTLTDSGNLASDPLYYYTHSPRADIQCSLVLSHFSATSSCAILLH